MQKSKYEIIKYKIYNNITFLFEGHFIYVK